MFLCMLFFIVTTTILLDIVVYSLYKKDVEKKISAYAGETIELLSENLTTTIEALEENMLYKIIACDVFRYQKNLSDANVYSIERNLQSFSALLNSGGIPVNGVYVMDCFRCSFYYSASPLMPGRMEDFRRSEAYSYIQDHYEAIAARKGVTKWIRFEGDDHNVYLIKSVLDLQTVEFVGIMCVAVDAQYLESQYQQLETNLESHLVIYDEEGRVLSCDGAMLETAKAWRQGESLEERYMIQEAPVRRENWTVVCFTEKNVVLAGMKNLMLRLLVLEAVIALVSVLPAFRISDSMTYNISALISRFQNINEGSPAESIRYHSHDETAYLCEKFNEMNAELKESIQKMTFSGIQKEKAEYSALQAQMNPHFLYNTLEAINALAKLEGNERIVECIENLGTLLRTSISGKEQEVTLEQEIEYISRYLALQQTITGDRMSWDMDIEQKAAGYYVPKLILQPIVENSLIHGIEDMTENAMIFIAAKIRDEKLIIEVSDNGKGMDESVAKRLLNMAQEQTDTNDRAHIGVNSVKRRIRILYGENYGLEIQSAIDAGTVVRLVLPCRREADHVSDLSGG